MGQKYCHLSHQERKLIFNWSHYQDKTIREIARLLNRSHSTISRELKRNIYDYYVPTYYPNPAHDMYKARMSKRAQREKLKTSETRLYVLDKLRKGWSPQIISGRLKLTNEAPYVCHKSIYQFVYSSPPELIACLARKHKKRRKKYPSRRYNKKCSMKTSILERPTFINERSQLGHWESDSVVSKHKKSALNVIIERATRLVHITKLSSKSALVTSNAIIKRLSSHPAGFVQSITYDNGSENAQHIKVNGTLQCDSYFCQPYHSWEKGAVEQINSLIRRYLPKGTDFSTVTNKQIQEIEHNLNSRPRRCLDYKTPFEIYNEKVGALPS
ncbi:IS30 family transposase [Pseudoalteromonas sp. R3]|uniref:IS30 family transposase n=1 Tax=Pseudoalteromonas sp. R3 TaxID=1709477 RepID=UPI000FDD2FF9|nr:IS30 family transposase [Pseudoalteromonas sp. R3]AZZ98094.1 IS30 family transposase [Pseudoalteromonas sp. R3]